MKQLLIVIVGIIGWMAVLAGGAAAQYRPSAPPSPVRPITSPGLSPYLNLLRGGNPAANYYLGVVPEQQRRQNEAQFGRGINQLQPRVEYLEGLPSIEETYQRITTPPASSFGVGPPAQFGRTLPGFGRPIPMPPEVRLPPKPKDNPPADK